MCRNNARGSLPATAITFRHIFLTQTNSLTLYLLLSISYSLSLTLYLLLSISYSLVASLSSPPRHLDNPRLDHPGQPVTIGGSYLLPLVSKYVKPIKNLADILCLQVSLASWAAWGRTCCTCVGSSDFASLRPMIWETLQSCARRG